MVSVAIRFVAQGEGRDACVCEISLYCPVNGSPWVTPFAEVGADLLGSALLKGSRCPGYLECWTVETINGVACVTKGFVDALEVHVHVIRATKEPTPAAFGVGFSDAIRDIKMWCSERYSRYFSKGPGIAWKPVFQGFRHEGT